MCIRDRYFPVVELYKNFNALPPLKLLEQQIFMLLHKFFHYSAKLPIVFKDYFTLNSHSMRNCNSLHVSSVQSIKVMSILHVPIKTSTQ